MSLESFVSIFGTHKVDGDQIVNKWWIIFKTLRSALYLSLLRILIALFTYRRLPSQCTAVKLELFICWIYGDDHSVNIQNCSKMYRYNLIWYMRRTFCMLKNLHAALFNEAINKKVTNSNVLTYLKFNELPFSKLPFSFFFFNSPIRKIRRLTHFVRLVPFFTPFRYTQKNKKQSGFLMFPGDVERE